MESKRHLYRAIIGNLERLGVPRNCVLIQLHELPAHDIAIRGGQPMSDILSNEPARTLFAEDARALAPLLGVEFAVARDVLDGVEVGTGWLVPRTVGLSRVHPVSAGLAAPVVRPSPRSSSRRRPSGRWC